MSTEAEVPSTRRVELSNGRWIELRLNGIVADARYQLQDRHERGDYDDFALNQLALVEARLVAWSFGDKIPTDMKLRRAVIDALSEDDALKLIEAVAVKEDPKDKPSRASSTGTRRSGRTARPTKNSTPAAAASPSSG